MLPLFVAIPLLGAFSLPLLTLIKGEEALLKRVRFGIVIIITFVLLWMSVSLLSNPTLVYWMGKFTPSSVIGINLVADGLTKIMLIVISTISLIVAIYSYSYMERFTSVTKFYALFLFMITGMNGVVLTGDLFNLFVFLEIAAISSYALVAFGVEQDELEASFKYLVLGSVASSFILLGIGLTYGMTGCLNMAQVAQILQTVKTSGVIIFIAGFFIAGFALKAAQVPFHAWLPDAHPSAPAPISAMLSGVLIKALGVYAIVRICYNVLGFTLLTSWILITLGMLSMVVGVFLAVGQWDFKRLLAYHSISQMGYVMVGLGIGTPLAIFGGLFHLINHAVFKSLLFLCSGAVEYATGTRNLKEIKGAGKSLPVTSATLRIASLSISGIPPFNGFFSKFFIILGAIYAKYYTVAAITVFVSFMTLVSFVKVQRYVVSEKGGAEAKQKVPFDMKLAMSILAIFCVVMGIYFGLIQANQMKFFKPAVEALRSRTMYIKLVLGG